MLCLAVVHVVDGSANRETAAYLLQKNGASVTVTKNSCQPARCCRSTVDEVYNCWIFHGCGNFFVASRMFANRFARAFSLHDVLGEIEGLGSSDTSIGVSQSVFHEVCSSIPCAASEPLTLTFFDLGTRSTCNIQGLATYESYSGLSRQGRLDICANIILP
jgi:hypothetical protein